MPVLPDDPRLQTAGFAKLEGDAVEFYIKKYEIVLGRNSKSVPVDVVLGDNMNISRQHAKIVYNFEKKCFELEVLGKNGVTLNEVVFTPESDKPALRSGDCMTIGDKTMFFLLPRTTPSFVEASSKKKRISGVGSGKPSQPRAKKPKVSPIGAPPTTLPTLTATGPRTLPTLPTLPPTALPNAASAPMQAPAVHPVQSASMAPSLDTHSVQQSMGGRLPTLGMPMQGAPGSGGYDGVVFDPHQLDGEVYDPQQVGGVVFDEQEDDDYDDEDDMGYEENGY